MGARKIKAIYFRNLAEDEDGELLCLCGSPPRHKGFYRCDFEGKDVPASRHEDWVPDWYVCTYCGQVFDVAREQAVKIVWQDASKS